MKCGAKSKSTGKPCQREAMANGRCYVHGGATPKGPQSPNFKHGRYSKYLPKQLADKYHDALTDPDLTNVRHEIALIDALIMENIDALDTGSNREFWKAAKEQIVWARQGYKSENYSTLERALDALDDLADQRVLHFEAEAELRDKIEQRRKLVETEKKIALQGERAVSADELMVFMGAVVDLITRMVDDKQKRYDILNSIDQLVAGHPPAIH